MQKNKKRAYPAFIREDEGTDRTGRVKPKGGCPEKIFRDSLSKSKIDFLWNPPYPSLNRGRKL